MAEKDPDNRRILILKMVWQKTGIKTILDHFKTDEDWSEISGKIGLKKMVST